MTMTPNNTPEATLEALQAELERLRTKNAELLTELKAAKSTAADALTAQAALQGERDTATAEIRRLSLDHPVEALLELLSVDAEIFRTMLAREFTFALDGDQIVILDLQGNRATVPGRDNKPRPAELTAEDVCSLCRTSPHSDRYDHVLRGLGSGGSGAPSHSSWSHGAKATASTSQRQPTQFGLR